MLERWIRLLKEHIHTNCEQMTRDPAGQLGHPYTVPAGPNSPYYSTALWDWDSWSTSIVLGQVEVDTDRRGLFAAYERGSLFNFFEHTDGDGVMPVQLTPEGTLVHGDATLAGGFAENMHKPVVAQHAALLAQRERSAEWVRAYMPTIGRFVDRYLKSHVHTETGLAYWQSDFAVGLDNDPSLKPTP